MKDFEIMLNLQDVYTIKVALKSELERWEQRVKESEGRGILNETAQTGYEMYKRIYDKMDEACMREHGFKVECK